MKRSTSTLGFALITVLLMLVVLMALLGAYFALTRVELSTSTSSATSVRGFYAAEGGLNLRAEDIRAKFIGYSRPSGTSPDRSGGAVPCVAGNDGTGDFACTSYTLGGQRVVTYVVPEVPSGTTITIPPGDDKFAGLNAIQYKYSVFSVAYGPQDKPSAIVEMDFLSRLVPLFQFAAFYENDLEIEPSPPMTLNGPVHTNANLYLDPHNTLDIHGQITTAGGVFLGQSPDDKNGHRECEGTSRVADKTGTLRALPGCPKELTDVDVATWGTQIWPDSGVLTVPDVSVLNPQPGNDFWDNADVRIMASYSGSPAIPKFEVFRPSGGVDPTATTALATCADTTKVYAAGQSTAALSLSQSFYNNREGKQITMVDLDVIELLDCLYSKRMQMGPGFNIDDASHGGLVWYVGVDMGDAGNSCTAESAASGCINRYGVRLRNGQVLASSVGGAPQIRGLTVVTNQASYVQGDYNVGGGGVAKKPAAVISDSMNILSSSWSDAAGGSGSRPNATSTTVNAAFLSGTDVSDGTSGDYSGGLENYPRFHENWSGDTFTYRGSFVSLGKPLHADGRWTSQVYSPPNRDFDYDTDFNDVANLPPLTPRFVYLKQLLFARQFSQ